MYKIILENILFYKRVIYAKTTEELEKTIHYALKVGYLVQNVKKLESGQEAEYFIKELKKQLKPDDLITGGK